MSPSGAVSGRFWWVINAAILLLFSFVLISCVTDAGASSPSPDRGDIVVTVIDLNGNKLVHGVVVRVTNTSQSDDEDNDGVKIESCFSGQSIAAWAPGYQVGFISCDGQSKSYAIQLQTLETVRDNPDYTWLSAYSDCRRCHEGQFGSSYNEFSEWKVGGHATVFQNPYYFETLYPAQVGICAPCHAPTTLLSFQTTADLTSMYFSEGDAHTEGVTCDVCHKVNGVFLENNQYPFFDKPGILAFQLVRADSFTLGPFSNIILTDPSLINTRHSMCSKIFSESKFCAACHYGRFKDTLIYSSYKEWKESVYAQKPNSATYRTCQDCHMSHMQNNNQYPFSKRSACSETDNGFQDFSHNMMDFGFDNVLQRDIPRMVRGAASIAATFEYKPEQSNSLHVHVLVSNKIVGHKFPTDSPLRQLILVLDVRDQFSNPLMRMGDGYIPNWGGVKGPSGELPGVKAYAGKPGKIFASLLVQADSHIDPYLAYWDQGLLTPATNGSMSIDTRLEPGGGDISDYYFAPPMDGEVRFTISLFYRFGPYDLMQQKGWLNFKENTQDILPTRADIPVVVVACNGNIEQPDQISCDQIDPPK